MAALQRIDTQEFLLKPDNEFVDVFDLHPLYEKLDLQHSLILKGPKGVGKTLSVAAFAAKKGVPIVTYDCSEDVRRSNLLGFKTPQEEFVLGPIPTAFEIANEEGHCILALEEINALTPQMQKVLNPIVDWRRSVAVPEALRVFKLQKDAKLWVVGTMNSTTYGGVFELNEDLRSRFRIREVTYPKPEAERKIIQAAFKNASAKPTDAQVKKVLTLAHETRQPSFDYALASRDVIQILEDIGTVGLEDALRNVVGKFEGTDHATIVQRMESIFGAKL